MSFRKWDDIECPKYLAIYAPMHPLVESYRKRFTSSDFTPSKKEQEQIKKFLESLNIP